MVMITTLSVFWVMEADFDEEDDVHEDMAEIENLVS